MINHYSTQAIVDAARRRQQLKEKQERSMLHKGILIVVAFWLCLFLPMILFSGKAHASVTDLKLSTAQIFDVQWYISGGKLNASGFSYIYASVNYATQTNSAARWTAAQTSDANSNGRYIGFFNSTTNPGTYGMAVFNSNGSVYKIINNTGSFRALADGAIFYNGNGMWGTLITTGQGYSLGQSGSWNVTQDNPNNAQLQAYTPPSDKPLASGETAQPSAPPPPAGPTVEGGTITQTNSPGTEVITSGGSSTAGINTSQQTRINTWKNTSQQHNNELYIDQIYGTNNTVNITQSGTKNKIDFSLNGNNNVINSTQTGRNYLKEEVPGWGNSITTTQTNTSGQSNYAETKIQGNGNTVNHQQIGTGSHVLFSNINGAINTVSSTQSGNTGHSLDVKMTGNHNSVISDQSGNTQNKANIDLTNAGGPATVDLQQTGGKNFTITQSCANPAGCNTTVRQ